MSIHREARRGELLHVPRAGMYVEDPAAIVAMEMMVVLVAGKFVAWRLARQLDKQDIPSLQQLFDVAVDRGEAEGRHVALGLYKDFCGE